MFHILSVTKVLSGVATDTTQIDGVMLKDGYIKILLEDKGEHLLV